MMKHLGLCLLLCCALGLFSLRTAGGRVPTPAPNSTKNPARLIDENAPFAPPTNPCKTIESSGNPVVQGLQLGALESLAVAETLLPRSGISSRILPRTADDVQTPFYCRESWNCSESVNFATSLSRNSTIYTHWALDIYSEDLESDATWHKIDCSLRRGDVVVFWIRERINGNREIDFATHTQICLGAANEMWGANNEPRFELVRGIPAPTKMWWVCSSREYFDALYGQDATWRSLGHERRYYVVVYRCPESRGSLVSR